MEFTYLVIAALIGVVIRALFIVSNSMSGENTNRRILFRKVKSVIKDCFKIGPEEGRWYWVDYGDSMALINYSISNCYGFSHDGFEWTNNYTLPKSWNDGSYRLTEATKEEVSKHLIKEARRRYRNRGLVEDLYGRAFVEEKYFGVITYYIETNDLWVRTKLGRDMCVFKDGEWAKVAGKVDPERYPVCNSKI